MVVIEFLDSSNDLEIIHRVDTIALLKAADLRLCGTQFLTTNELSQFVLASPMANRHMLEPLASVLREGFRKRGQREIFEKEIFERDVI